MMGLSISVFGFFTSMVRDTARRELMADFLKDMIRPHEVVTNLDTAQISKVKSISNAGKVERDQIELRKWPLCTYCSYDERLNN